MERSKSSKRLRAKTSPAKVDRNLAMSLDEIRHMTSEQILTEMAIMVKVLQERQ